MKLNPFRSLLVIALALVLSTALFGPDNTAAQTVSWKMATKMPPESPEGKAFQKFADLVKEKSNGKMVIDVFPAEQLGKTEATMEQLQAGLINIYPEGDSYLQKYRPEMKYTGLPFLFESREHWVKFMDSDLVRGWLDSVAKNDNIMVLGEITDFVRGPYRVMVSKKPVKSLADVNGLKLRLHPDDVAIAAWKRLGANTIVLPWTEIYESLGRGIVEACNSPMALVESMKFYEQAKYIIRHNEYPQGIAFMTNYKAFNALSPDLKEAVLAAHKEACAFSAQIMGKVAEESIARMQAKGAEYSTIDTKPFVDRLNGLYRQWEEEGKLPKGFLEQVAVLAK
ncbi:MAG: TRAP transporter substrate-binding protein [Desulfobacterales bacterium]|jgi:tripartite ATP-independent transporter DctP family solute receptor